MRYSLMRPCDLKKAIENNVPVLLPVGVIEYHSGHLPLGTDGLVVEGVLSRLEKKHPEAVILPAFYYGTASYAVAGADKGTVSVDSDKVRQVMEDVFSALLETGFKNIHAFIAHQTGNFVQGMPTDLALRFAARRAIFSFIENNKGKGWWGKQNCGSDEEIFNMITVHAFSEGGIAERFEEDHAGKQETSAMMELYPELVNSDDIDENDWFALDAVNATKEYGLKYVNAVLGYLEKLLF